MEEESKEDITTAITTESLGIIQTGTEAGGTTTATITAIINGKTIIMIEEEIRITGIAIQMVELIEEKRGTMIGEEEIVGVVVQ
jgi:hypothetical protein